MAAEVFHAERVESRERRVPPQPSDGNPKGSLPPPGSSSSPPRVTRGRLVLQNINKSFPGSNVPALKDVTVVAEPGEFLVLVGPSGCGKSTLLNVAAGMLKADSGTVEIDGQRVTQPGPDRAVVFQDHGLFPWLNAAANIEFGLKMKGMSKSERQDRVADALKMVHLSNAGHKLVHELSGGMHQRVAIARSLVLDPACLLMDEPFAALDAQTRTLLHAQLQELWLNTNKTVLFVTHSVGEAVRLADRVIILHSYPGRVRRELKINLQHPRDFDGPELTELGHIVRKEIEDEVNRVNVHLANDFWSPEKAAHLDPGARSVGDGL